MPREALKNIVKDLRAEKQPVIFVGHGNPMNAITDNIYREGWIELGQVLVKPRAILCISAHWLTNGTAVTTTKKPETIHDFGGFPDELYEVEYPAPGAPDVAQLVIETIKSVKIKADLRWGLDHGAWSVISNLYPAADVPVFQLSIDDSQPLQYHYDLGRELAFLRAQGVLVVCSGNLVHNLYEVRWEAEAKPHDWALEFDAFVAKSLEEKNAKALIDYQQLGKVAKLAHPSDEHYLPLLYAVGLRGPEDKMVFFNEGIELGSMSMRSVVFY